MNENNDACEEHSFRGHCVWCGQFQIGKFSVLFDGPSVSSLMCPKGRTLILFSS